MNDKELLELAAKAAGYGEVWYVEGSDTAYVGPKYVFGEPIGYRLFNPLTDDGDALRLAVKLRLELGFPRDYCVWSFGNNGVVCMEDPTTDSYAATRRAIVRAAAEIGGNME